MRISSIILSILSFVVLVIFLLSRILSFVGGNKNLYVDISIQIGDYWRVIANFAS